MENQQWLCCGCGEEVANGEGRCARCERRERLSREHFGGQREQVLARDRYCRGCGRADALVVHHRRPGDHRRVWLVVLCQTCHARVHRTYRPTFYFPETLRRLWREAHPGLAEQRRLLLLTPDGPRPGADRQAALFVSP